MAILRAQCLCSGTSKNRLRAICKRAEKYPKMVCSALCSLQPPVMGATADGVGPM